MSERRIEIACSCGAVTINGTCCAGGFYAYHDAWRCAVLVDMKRAEDAKDTAAVERLERELYRASYTGD